MIGSESRGSFGRLAAFVFYPNDLFLVLEANDRVVGCFVIEGDLVECAVYEVRNAVQNPAAFRNCLHRLDKARGNTASARHEVDANRIDLEPMISIIRICGVATRPGARWACGERAKSKMPRE